MARLTADGDYVVCDRCRMRLAAIATAEDHKAGVVTSTTRLMFMLPGWQRDGSRLSERPRTTRRRRAGHPPPLMPRRFMVGTRGRRGSGPTRGPGMVAPIFPELGMGAFEIRCTDCGTVHEVNARDIDVTPIPEQSYFEPLPDTDST